MAKTTLLKKHDFPSSKTNHPPSAPKITLLKPIKTNNCPKDECIYKYALFLEEIKKGKADINKNECNHNKKKFYSHVELHVIQCDICYKKLFAVLKHLSKK